MSNEPQLPESPNALIGRRIAGKMEVLEHLGGGGMGWVFSAYHHALGKKIAIKVLKRLGDPLHAQRFALEARSASRLEHPNAVTILDFGEDGPDRLVYLAMEFLEGQDLDRIIRLEAPMEPRRAVSIMAQVLAALTSAHESGVIHRDLKPANVMVASRTDDDGELVEFVKVCDFGLAKIMDGERPGPGLTRRGMIVGTPEYMSPEQAVGDPLDGRTDVYACGVILYEMLTGRRPFEAEDPGEILLMHLNNVPRPLRARVSSIPEELERVVLWAMEKRLERRVSSARELRDALKRFLARPDPFDLQTVVDLEQLMRGLNEPRPAPESITDQVQAPRLASSDRQAAARPGPDTLLEEPMIQRSSSADAWRRGTSAPADPISDDGPTGPIPPGPREPPSDAGDGPTGPIPPGALLGLTPVLAEVGVSEPPPTPDHWEADVLAQETLRAYGEPEVGEPAPYEGPSPFWFADAAARVSGPWDYLTLNHLVQDGLLINPAAETSVSFDGESWLGLTRYLELTAQEALRPGNIAPATSPSPPMGDLSEISGVAMLANVASWRPSGRLVVEHGRGRTEIHLRRGQPVEVRSSDPAEQLPALLVSRDLVRPDALASLVHTALRTDTRVQEVLASAVDLRVLRTALMKERLLAVVALQAGSYGLDVQVLPAVGSPLAPSLLPLLPNMVFRALSEAALLTRLAPALSRPLSPRVDAEALLSELQASPAQHEAAVRLSSGAALAELLDEVPEQRHVMASLAYTFIEVGVLEVL
ncbi:MAG: protein kinase [Myxococcales bacterium]|nr:protein kinase [Myxococcales bacterium]